MPRKIGTTIAVDGEAAFKRAISEATTSLRNMGTQLTLAQAQFKKDGDAMKLMETRSKALKGEIGQQGEIVKALEKAVEDSTKAYGENSAKTEKWQAELNRAKAKLIGLQSELTLNEAGLDRNGKAFEDSTEKAADYQATLQTIGKGVGLESISKGVGGITSLLESAITKVIELGKKVTETMREAASWADDLITKSIVNGLSIEDQQRMEYASKFADVSVDAIMSARDRVIKKMVGGWKSNDMDMWEFLGIDASTTRDPMEVLFELGETFRNAAKIDGSDVRADAWAMEVFGRSYRELLPLFEFGAGNFYKKMSEAPLVNEENVKKLGSLNDQFDDLDSRLQALKMTALSELAPAMEGIVGSINTMLEEFNSWLETEEGKEAMQELAEAVGELFSGLGDVDFKDAVEKVKGAITDIKNALIWMSEHKQDVVTALEVIAGGFALLKVTDLALNIGKIVHGFQTLWDGAHKPLPSLPGAAGAEAAGAEAAGAEATGTAGAAAAGSVLPFVGTVAGLGYIQYKAWEALGNYRRANLDKVLGTNENLAAATAGDSELIRIFSEFIRTQDEQSKLTGAEDWDEQLRIINAATAASEAFWKQEGAEKLYDSYQAWRQERSMGNDWWGLPDNWAEITGDAIREAVEDTVFNTGKASPLKPEYAALLSGGYGSKDGLKDLPGQIERAARDGTARGVNGVRVTMDGYTVGRIVAPYVSAEIGGASQ